MEARARDSAPRAPSRVASPSDALRHVVRLRLSLGVVFEGSAGERDDELLTVLYRMHFGLVERCRDLATLVEPVHRVDSLLLRVTVRAQIHTDISNR